MATSTADFELGSVGSSLSTGDPGSLTPWASVSIVGGGIIRYSSTQVAHGAKSCLMQGDNVTGAGSASFTLASLTDWFGRIYFQPTGVVSSSPRIVNTAGSSGEAFGISFNPDRSVSITNASFLPVSTSSTKLTLNQWARLEWHVNHGTGAATLEIYTSMDSATPTETLNITESFGTNVTGIAFGQGDSASTAGIYFDQIAVGAPLHVGPFPVNSVAPTISGLAAVGSVLTAANGTWNGTFDFSYQWTRDGVDIGGATGSTYTSQNADASHVVGVKVTATGQQSTNESAVQASSNTVSVTAASVAVPGPAPLVGRFP